MGRFETTAEFYRYREPYPEAFFDEIAARLALSRDTRLLDVGSGPGNLAIGFTPFVGTCTAIDIEPEMLRVARQAAADAGANIRFILTRVEDLDVPDNSFDLVTIGRALHWLEQHESLSVFERVVAPGGSIASCGCPSTDANDWLAGYKRLRKAWSPDHDESRYKIDMNAWFAPSSFRNTEEICVPYKHQVTIDDLVQRALSFSNSSPAVLGDKRPQFEQELRAVLAPFARDGQLEEELMAKAAVFRRTADGSIQ